MAKITYNTHDNKTHSIDIQNGLTVMEGAVQNDIPGIDADCGGGMACATCHVYVNEEWFDKIPVKEDGEEDMLDMAYEPNKFSRLSCQIIVSEELDGLVVNIPSKTLSKPRASPYQLCLGVTVIISFFTDINTLVSEIETSYDRESFCSSNTDMSISKISSS